MNHIKIQASKIVLESQVWVNGQHYTRLLDYIVSVEDRLTALEIRAARLEAANSRIGKLA